MSATLPLRRDAGPRRLLLSIHDVGPRSEGAVDALRELLGRHAGSSRVALLVVPDHWGEAPIRAGTPFAARLRSWAEAGAEILLHGWHHRDGQRHASLAARLRARHLTAGEGEFLGLPYASALALIERGRALLEDVTGGAVAGFVAPAWLYGPGALAALAAARMPLAEDHLRVWRPTTGEVVARGPVLTWASRSRGRIVASLLAGRALPPLLRRLPTARIAVHPGDVAVPALTASIARSVADLVRSHRPACYRDLLDRSPAGARR